MIKYEDVVVGTQIAYINAITENKTNAVCISANNEALDFLSDIGSLYFKKENFDEIVQNFDVEIIDETHHLWQKVDKRVFNFFSKLNELEEKYNKSGQETDDDFLLLLEELGDEFDDNI
jgi:hypothetical protein